MKISKTDMYVPSSCEHLSYFDEHRIIRETHEPVQLEI